MKQNIFYFLIFLSIGIFFGYQYLDSIEYEPLDSCLRATVSNKTICDKSINYVGLDKISPYFLEAVVASEDDKFYDHNGFDFKEFKNSLLLNMRSLSFVRGGSTITQQLVKNIYLSHSKSIIRKIKEAYIAHQIEKEYSKNLILEKYVNTIQFGRGLWGIERASEHYFGMHPENLGVLESLYLVVLLPSPVKYSKSYEEDKLTDYQRKRIKTLLSRLTRKGAVEPEYAEFLEKDIDNFPWGGKSLDYEGPIDTE